MAERRMFSKSVIVSDRFFDMSVDAKYLYFMFGIDADDDGFVGSPKTIMRQCGIKSTALDELIQNSFVIPFDSGVVAIRHWKVNNYLRNDRHKNTIHTKEMNSLCEDENGIYFLSENTGGIPSVYQRDTQHRIEKESTVQHSISSAPGKPKTEKEKQKYGTYQNVFLSDEDVNKLKVQFPADYQQKIEALSEGIELKGYRYKNHYLAILKWAKNESDQAKENQKYAAYDLEAYNKMLNADD